MKIPKRFGIIWDGGYKDYTKDCHGCEWYRKIDNQELCGWGVAFKYLITIEKPRKCGIKNREQTPYASVRYLDEVIKNAMD